MKNIADCRSLVDSPDGHQDDEASHGKKRTRSPNEDGSRGPTKADINLGSDECKPKLKSLIVNPNLQQKVADEKERQNLLNSQRNDKGVMDRNRRMFGLLMGTLKQFKTEEVDREKSTFKRTKVEERIETDDVDCKRHNRISNLDQTSGTTTDREKIYLAELRKDEQDRFDNWEKSHKHLGKYIQTETKPKLFWLPKEHNPETERRLKVTRDYFSICLAEKTAKFRKVINELDNDLTE